MKKIKNLGTIPEGVIPKKRPELPPRFVSSKINKEYWATFAFYDSKGRRLSIFGRPSNIDRTVTVTVLQLSKERNPSPSDLPYSPPTGPADSFDKSTAKQIYETQCMGVGVMTKKPGREFNIEMLEGETIAKAIVRYARENYYVPVPKQVTIFEFHKAKFAPKPEKKKEKQGYEIYIKHAGPNKLMAVKIVKDITGCGLKEAKETIDSAPVVLNHSFPKQMAEEAVQLFLISGVEAEIR